MITCILQGSNVPRHYSKQLLEADSSHSGLCPSYNKSHNPDIVSHLDSPRKFLLGQKNNKQTKTINRRWLTRQKLEGWRK